MEEERASRYSSRPDWKPTHLHPNGSVLSCWLGATRFPGRSEDGSINPRGVFPGGPWEANLFSFVP